MEHMKKEFEDRNRKSVNRIYEFREKKDIMNPFSMALETKFQT